MRWIKGILRVKDWEKKKKAKEIEEIDRQISALEAEIKVIEIKMDELNQSIKTDFSFEKLVEFRGLLEKKKNLEKDLTILNQQKARKQEELKSIYREIKGVEVVKHRLEYELRRKESSVEMLRSNFFHLIKKFLIFLLLIPTLTVGQSAIQKKIKERKESKVENELKLVTKELEEKLRKLEQERKKLEELRQVEPKKEEMPPDFQKLVAIFNRADSDEAGAIMNNMNPNLAAEILLRLREQQAAAILSAMDPQKAAEVSQIMANKKGKIKKAP